MFEPQSDPRIFATPLGVDFCQALIDGIEDRLQGAAPEALARVEIHVANARMQRRLQALYAARGPGLLPRIRPVLSLSEKADLEGLPPAMSPLAVRLRLAQLIDRLLQSSPDLAPRSAIYDLADSLADFLGEMAEEGVLAATVASLDVGEHSTHWKRAQDFLNIVTELQANDSRPTPEARQAMVVDRLVAEWRLSPPAHPVIVAGSTGSRRATFRLMEVVATLPQGAVILPGLDTDMPSAIWDGLLDGRRTGLAGEDHPQFRLAKVLGNLGVSPTSVKQWGGAVPVNPARNRAVSLALRPAPVTDQWRTEGPGLSDLAPAFADVTLLEAPSPQMEAAAIALRLRQAAEDGQRAAVVTPDRQLARRITAQLDRWDILPDDSAGMVLAQTAPGRFLRQVAEALAKPLTAEALIALLKHPLCLSGADRQQRNLRVERLELHIRRHNIAFPTLTALMEWASDVRDDEGVADWVNWLNENLIQDIVRAPLPLAERVALHRARADALAAGPDVTGSGELYDKEPGQTAADLMEELAAEAPGGGAMTARDYADFFAALTADRDVRSALRPHADILIWGTQEARVQGADLTILAGLNEGTWPAAPEADPWLNRPLRADAGLRLPDRVIGLSAHDFQQGIAGREVWLSRSKRDDEAETVPSRWLNRLTNLLSGASEASATALDTMRVEGDRWVSMARSLIRPDATVPPEPRPAPAPQSGPRLTHLSVTDLERLVRDPYAIYAYRILGLRPLDPLRAMPDARLRGTILHKVMQDFVQATPEDLPDNASALLQEIAARVLQEEAPWPAARQLWEARFARIIPWYLEQEAELRRVGSPWIVEDRHAWEVPGLGLTLSAIADRIDICPDGSVAIYDYKTGKVPTEKEAKFFNKQLLLEALMAEGGAFADRPLKVGRLAYIGLGASPEIRDEPTDADSLAEVRAGLFSRITHHRRRDVGFSARRSPKLKREAGDYDHLARYGEWDETDDPVVIPVGARDDG